MSLFELLEKIVAAEEEEVSLKLPEEKINLLSLKILKREAERRGKKLKLKPSGSRGRRLISTLEGGVEPEPVAIKGGFKLPRLRLGIIFTKRFGLILLLLFGIFLLLGGGGYWFLYLLPRAEVILALKPIPMVKEVSVSASTEATEIDAEKNIIPGTELTVEEEGQKSTPATGTAMVGEKAKGTVTFTSLIDQHCLQGTKIKEIESGLLLFVDTAMELTSLGPKDYQVTAEKIGSEYNIASGKIFNVLSGCADNSKIAGKNGAQFEGGSSKQVMVVSAADQTKTLEELQKELIEKGKTDLAEQAGLDQVVIEKAIKQEVVEKTFHQAVGEEAEEVSLTLKMKFTVIVYKDKDLKGFISQVLDELIPENYELFPGEMGIETLEPKLSDKTLNFSAKVTAQVIPKLDLEEIKNNLVGRNAASAQEYLASLSNVTAYELRLYPNLPENLRRIPRSTERIRIELQTETEEEL